MLSLTRIALVLAVVAVAAVAAPARASSTCRDGEVEYTLEMTDRWGDGWDDAAYNFTRSSDGAASTGTLARGATGTAALCLAPADVGGCHVFKVSAGSYPSEVGWSIVSAGGTVVCSGEAPANASVCFGTTPLPREGTQMLEECERVRVARSTSNIPTRP